MHIDPLLPVFTGAALAIFIIGIALRRFGQPTIIGYLIAGIVLGPSVLKLATDEVMLAHLGSVGVILLLFFIGMETSPKRLLADWKVSVIGTTLQIVFSVCGVFLLGSLLDWPLARIILLGFVISLSCTAVVIRVLQEKGELDSHIGGQVLGILLVQDMAIIPMLIGLGFLAGDEISAVTLVKQGIGGICAIGLLLVLARKHTIHLPLQRFVGDDHEIQVFAAFILCFGLAFLTGLLELSTALGAFMAGVIVASARETDWVHHAIEPFRVVFVAIFFVSIGMLLDLRFVAEFWHVILALTVLVFVTNTCINTLLLRLFDNDWKSSFYGGTLLAPIGEMSFVLASVGRQSGMISSFGYQATIATITVTLLIGPLFTAIAKSTMRYDGHVKS